MLASRHVHNHVSRHRTSLLAITRRLVAGAAVLTTMGLGGCGGLTNPFDFASVTDKPAAKSDVETGALPQTELQKATEYWGKKFEANPKDPQPAINYARNLKALDAKAQALGVLQQAYAVNPTNRGIASEYGRLALEQDQVSLAEKLLAQADDPVAPDWKVISARGTVLAKQGKYRDAIVFFERAQALAPNQSSVINNLALAYAMDGHAEKAEPMLRQAAQDKSADPKVGRNLALVLGLEGKSDEAKSVLVKNVSAADADEDVAVVKQLVGATPAAAQPAPVVTGSMNQNQVPNKPKAKAKAKPAAVQAHQAAAAEDPSVLVQKLADGYANTPADAPVQLTPAPVSPRQ